MRSIGLLIGVTVIAAMAGCFSQAPQQERGLVTLDGRPLASAVVFFQLEGEQNATAMGTTNRAGVVIMRRVSSRQAIPPGTYRVIVNSMDRAPASREQEAPLAVPRIYADASTTPLTIEVPTGGDCELKLVTKPNR